MRTITLHTVEHGHWSERAVRKLTTACESKHYRLVVETHQSADLHGSVCYCYPHAMDDRGECWEGPIAIDRLIAEGMAA